MAVTTSRVKMKVMVITVWIELINVLFFPPPALHACRNTLILDSATLPSCPAMVEDMEGAVTCGHCLNPMKVKWMRPQNLLCLVSANIPQSWAGGELKGAGWPGRPDYGEHVGGSLPPWLPPDLYIVNPAKTGARAWLCELDLLNAYSLCSLAQVMKSSPIRLLPSKHLVYPRDTFHFVVS